MSDSTREHRLKKVYPYNKTMKSTKQNGPISDRKFASIERMRTNVLEKARERQSERK